MKHLRTAGLGVKSMKLSRSWSWLSRPTRLPAGCIAHRLAISFARCAAVRSRRWGATSRRRFRRRSQANAAGTTLIIVMRRADKEDLSVA